MLTSLHQCSLTSQVNMSELPQKHASWIVQLAQKLPGKKGSPKRLIKSKIVADIVGWDSSTGSTTTTTHIWTISNHKQKFASAVLSCMRCDAEILGKNLSKETLWERPLTMCQQPLWKVIGQAPSHTQEGTPITTSRYRPKATSAPNLQPMTKRPYPQWFPSISYNKPYSHMKDH